MDELTDFQLEVLGHVAMGLTDHEIARKVFKCLRTVKVHKSRAFKALGALNGAHAVAIAYDAGLFIAAPTEPLPVGMILAMLVRAHGYKLTRRIDEGAELPPASDHPNDSSDEREIICPQCEHDRRQHSRWGCTTEKCLCGRMYMDMSPRQPQP